LVGRAGDRGDDETEGGVRPTSVEHAPGMPPQGKILKEG